MTVMAETSFGVRYTGPAVEDGRMPVRDLAPALLALGEVFTEASLFLHPKQDPVALEIQATAEGSFVVDLILHAPGAAWDQMSTLASSDAATMIVFLKELVVGNSVDTSLFGLFKWLKGRKVVEREAAAPGKIRFTTADVDSIEVPSDVAVMHDNIRIRRRVQRFVEPLGRQGVDGLEFRSDEEVTLSLEETDLPSFELPPSPEAALLDEEIELYLEVVSPTFKDDNKWRLSDGDKIFWAQILDEDFWHKVDTGESFSKGDKLHCRVQLIQSEQEDGKLHTERRVIRVLKHLPAPTQLPLEGEILSGEESTEPGPPEGQA